MYFKITSFKLNDDDIKFEFFDNSNPASYAMNDRQSPERKKDAKDVYSSSVWSGEGTTNFYTIQKDKKYLKDNIEGKFLAIYFDTDYEVLIENYKKSSSSTNTVIVVVIFVVIIIILIIYYCIRKKRNQAEINDINNEYNGIDVKVNNNHNKGNFDR
jgi:hypothetical protein